MMKIFNNLTFNFTGKHCFIAVIFGPQIMIESWEKIWLLKISLLVNYLWRTDKAVVSKVQCEESSNRSKIRAFASKCVTFWEFV